MQHRATTELFAVLAGAVLVLIGALGFVPGATAHVGELRFAGEHSHAKLFGTFKVSVLLNLLRGALGVGVLLLARATRPSRALLAGGTSLLVLWAVGAVAAGRFVPLTPADNGLHFALAIALIGASVA
jgi:Domain of unknown function (DUF4383)